MAHQLIITLATLVIAGGILAFGIFCSLGFVLLFALLGSGGNFFDLYRVRRFGDFSLNRLRSHLSLRRSNPEQISGSVVLSAQDSAQDDDLALALAASLDKVSVQGDVLSG